MAEQAGYTLTIVANEFDVSTYNNQLNLVVNRQAVNTSGFGDADKEYIAGQVDGTYSLVGTWNDDTAADLEHSTNLGLEIVYTACPAGMATAGNAAWLWNGLQNQYGIPANTNDAVRHNLAGNSPNTRMGGQLVHTLSTASVGQTASVDGTASSTFGGVGHLHVTAFSGTNIVATLEDSANDVTFATLAAFTSATGVGAERITFAGTVERYVRVDVSGTFTSATIAVAFARNRY